MSETNVPLFLKAAFFGSLFSACYWIVYQAFISPLSRIPAARWHARILPFYNYCIQYAGIECRATHELHSKLGPVVRLSPNVLSVNCFEGGLKTIYTGGFPKTELHARLFTFFRVKNITTSIDSREHALRKRMLSGIYSKSSIFSSSVVRTAASDLIYNKLFPLIRQSINEDKPLNMQPLNVAFSVDIFTSFALGRKGATDFITDQAQMRWCHERLQSWQTDAFWIGLVPSAVFSWMQKVPLLRSLVPPWCIEGGTRTDLENWTLGLCDHVADLTSGQKDLQGTDDWPLVFATQQEKLLGVSNGNNQVILPDIDNPNGSQTPHSPSPSYPYRRQIASELIDQLGGALDINGPVLTFLQHELSKRPDLQAALRQELLALGPEAFNTDTQANIPEAILKPLDSQCPLLEAVLFETMRRYPPVGGFQPRLTPTVCTIGGYDNIPPGVTVQASAWTLHRNPDVFPDPEEWRPERWIESSPEQLAEMRRWFWPFSSGPRVCIGRHFVMLVNKLLVATIYTHFTTSLVDGDEQVMGQRDGFISGVEGDRLMLRFKEVN